MLFFVNLSTWLCNIIWNKISDTANKEATALLQLDQGVLYKLSISSKVKGTFEVINMEATSPAQLGLWLIREGIIMVKVIRFMSCYNL